MKKIFSLFLLIFNFVIITQGQNNQFKEQQQQYYLQEDTYETEVYIDWVLSNKGGYDIPSFYWLITRSKNKFEGYYVFDVWFYSNSYNWDFYLQQPVWVYTYVSNVFVLLYGEYINKEPVWVTFQDKFTYKELRFYSINKNPRVNLTYDRPIIP